MKTDYFPSEEAKVVNWYSNFALKFKDLAAGLGLADELASVQADAVMVRYLIADYKGGFDTSRTGVTGFANKMLDGGIAAPTEIAPFPVAPVFAGAMVEPNIIGRTRKLVGRIKTAPDYTEEIGKSLGIVATGESEELTAPTLTVMPLAGRKLRIKWHKGGATGLELFVDFGLDYPKQGRVLTEPDQTITIEGVEGSGPVSAKVKGIYQKKGEEIGELGPTYATLLLP